MVTPLYNTFISLDILQHYLFMGLQKFTFKRHNKKFIFKTSNFLIHKLTELINRMNI